MPTRPMTAAVFAAACVVASGVASADMSRNVISAFRGQLVISKNELPEGKNDKESIAKIKSEKLSELVGEKTGEDITAWHFHYTAFLNKTGSSSLKMEFYRDGKVYSADKRLDGVDPKSTVLSGEISIDENEGLAKGKAYVIKLVDSKDAVVASTPLVFK
jgi:hypothetical protein